MKQLIKSTLRKAGYELMNIQKPSDDAAVFPPDFSEADKSLYLKVRPYTLTTPERVYALARALEYVSKNNIPGSVVECGVYKGGSMMVAAYVLLELQDLRDLYLYDTFEGMTAPTEEDDVWTQQVWQKNLTKTHNKWVYSPIDEVKNNLSLTRYPREKLQFIKGPVENTIPSHVPREIALLRLDTDFYASTRHELVHLFPRLVTGGVIIIDDYGSFRGSRHATDEYFSQNGVQMFLNRIDWDSRIGVKH